jgi:hypothetical protein
VWLNWRNPRGSGRKLAECDGLLQGLSAQAVLSLVPLTTWCPVAIGRELTLYTVSSFLAWGFNPYADGLLWTLDAITHTKHWLSAMLCLAPVKLPVGCWKWSCQLLSVVLLHHPCFCLGSPADFPTSEPDILGELLLLLCVLYSLPLYFSACICHSISLWESSLPNLTKEPWMSKGSENCPVFSSFTILPTLLPRSTASWKGSYLMTSRALLS